MSATTTYPSKTLISRSEDTFGIRWALSRMARSVQVWRDARALSQFSDDMLKDIGISRSEIEHGVQHGRF